MIPVAYVVKPQETHGSHDATSLQASSIWLPACLAPRWQKDAGKLGRNRDARGATVDTVISDSLDQHRSWPCGLGV